MNVKPLILLVDDEADVRGVLAEILEKDGFSVLQAGSYPEALQALNAVGPESVNLLVTDVSLPGPNGCEVAIAFLQRNSSGRVLFISGYTGAEICQNYHISLSDSDFLAKPLHPGAFRERIGALLEAPDKGLPSWATHFIGQAGKPGNRDVNL